MKALIKYRKNVHDKYTSFSTDLSGNNPLDVILYTLRRTDVDRFEIVIEKCLPDLRTLETIKQKDSSLKDYAVEVEEIEDAP